MKTQHVVLTALKEKEELSDQLERCSYYWQCSSEVLVFHPFLAYAVGIRVGVLFCSYTLQIHHEFCGTETFSVFVVCQDAFGQKTTDISEVDCAPKEVDMAIAVASVNTADDDQPLSTWIGGMHSSSVEELSKLQVHINKPLVVVILLDNICSL